MTSPINRNSNVSSTSGASHAHTSSHAQSHAAFSSASAPATQSSPPKGLKKLKVTQDKYFPAKPAEIAKAQENGLNEFNNSFLNNKDRLGSPNTSPVADVTPHLANWISEDTGPGGKYDRNTPREKHDSMKKYKEELTKHSKQLLVTDLVCTQAIKKAQNNALDSSLKSGNPHGRNNSRLPLNDEHYQKAAEWATSASTTVRESDHRDSDIAHTASVIKNHVESGTDLTNYTNVDTVHNDLNIEQSRTQRLPLPGTSVLPSSASGRNLFVHQMTKLNNKKDSISPENRSNHILGNTIGAHGYVDGNGRTGRTAYAINSLQNGIGLNSAGNFQGMSDSDISKFTGLSSNI